jgi:hypothetical protein
MWGDAVMTGDDGRFTIAHLPRNASYAISAFQPGAGEAIASHVAIDRSDVALVLRASGAITGVVVTPDGAAPDDVLVHLAARGALRSEIDRDEHAFHTGGHFAFRDLPPGEYHVRVDGDPTSTVIVTLGDGEQRDDLRLVVHPHYAIRGRLVAGDGHALAGWRVTAPQLDFVDPGSDGSRHISVYNTVSAVSRLDGQFVLHDLPGGSTTLSVAAPDAADDTPLRDVVLAGSGDVDLGDVPVGSAAQGSQTR